MMINGGLVEAERQKSGVFDCVCWCKATFENDGNWKRSCFQTGEGTYIYISKLPMLFLRIPPSHALQPASCTNHPAERPVH